MRTTSRPPVPRALQVLMVNLGLTDLNLSWNKLRPRGMAHLAEGIRPNLTLQVVAC
jgi:hypothetical protein